MRTLRWPWRHLARDRRDARDAEPEREGLTPTGEEIRREQEAAVERAEAQLASGAERVEVGGRLISRESAWAATQALRAAWRLGMRPDGPEVRGDGGWWARCEAVEGTTATLVLVDLGFFPG